MVAAVRGARMGLDNNDDDISDPLAVILVGGASAEYPSLLQVAEAFGFPDTDTYLNALEREGPRIFRRMQW